MDLKIILLFICMTFVIAASAQDAEVETKLGKIIGSYMFTRLGKKIYTFRGVRYAKPPTGDRRFKVAEPIEPWEGTFNAAEEGPSCIRPAGKNLAEDCLALNVYTTKLPTETNKVKRPVIVFFHPGAFVGYSAQSQIFGPQYYLDQDIVLVTVNYRLSALGFISTGDNRAPGNVGLKDQVQALRFVRDHIASFGGDPNSVTITGYSAGGTSVALHVLSPMSRGLFHRAISMSGSPIKLYLLPNHQREILAKQATFVGCPSEDIDETLKCMKDIPAMDFASTLSQFTEFYTDPITSYSPVVEPEVPGIERFLPAQPIDIIRSKNFNHVPLILGITKDEVVWIALQGINQARAGNDSYFQDLNREWERVAPISFQYERGTEKSKHASREVKKFYFNNEKISLKNADKLAQVYADSIVGFPVNRLASLLAANNREPVHYYKFAYQGRYSHEVYSDTKAPFGVVHHDDLLYIFYISYGFPFFFEDDPEAQMVDKMTALWANFAKTGEAVPKDNKLFENLTWDALTPQNQKYLEINDTFAIKSHLYADRYALWDRLFPLPPNQNF